MGLPAHWPTINRWLAPERPVYKPPPRPPAPIKKKCPDIPTLSSYKTTPSSLFWSLFPHRPLPTVPGTPVNVPILTNMLNTVRSELLASQISRGKKLIAELTHGVDALQMQYLPGAIIPNSGSVFTHGEVFTDVLAFWIRQGFVAGPFPAPPCPDFRANSMMAVKQKDKVRIIMNLSEPEGTSFNDNVDKSKAESVHMSTAKDFGYAVVECGHHARMWKFDMSDAYKNLPARISDLRLQGFCWLQAYFVETQQAFGASTAVAAFDRLGHTVLDLAILSSQIPKSLVFRTLDDVPVVTPASSSAGPRFAAVYSSLCRRLNISLAAQCPSLDKAFADSTVGTVLGIRFDTTHLTWTVNPVKRDAILQDIAAAVSGQLLSLEDMQHLMGVLNDFGQMCPFLKAFKLPLNRFLARLLRRPEVHRRLPVQATADLRVWAAVVEASAASLPIPHRPVPPSLSALHFVSDAAGARYVTVKRRRIPTEKPGDRGAAAVGITSSGSIWFCARVTWPTFLLLHARDERDKAYGCKSTTLELVGLLLPILTIPHVLQGREVCLHVDNIAAVYGWENRGVKNDTSASVLLRALHIISSYLGCTVHVLHLPRMSTPVARLADRLSRRRTTTYLDKRRIRRALRPPIPSALQKWLADPKTDWDLPSALLLDVQATLRRHL